MKRLAKTAGAILLSASMAAFASAIPMGSIEINLDTSDFWFDSSNVDFEQPVGGEVNDATGDFTHLVGQDIIRKDFDYTSIPAGGIDDLWAVAGAGVSFSLAELLYSDYTAVGNFAFLTLSGRGWLNVEGDSIPALWSFSADSNTGRYNYSSTTTTTSVPDSGASVAMLGFGLLCVGAVARMKKRSAA